MKADLVKREPQRLAEWEQGRLYERIQAQRAGAPKFVLHDGPPFANGDVHIGTALNKSLKDFIIKYKTLRGFDAPYIPGWDCHGLPIEFKVSSEMRKAGDTSSDPATIRRACDAYARKYIDLQRTQFRRLGVLGDWGNPYLTLNKEYEAQELSLFADLVEAGFVYRGKKPVYWSIPCRTALAEAEVEYNDHVSQSVFVKCPLVGHANTFVVIWTTTPWTLPANLAIAYNSKFDYAQVRVGDDHFIVSAALLPQVVEKCGWDGYEIVRSLQGEQFADQEYQHPFLNRRGRMFAGDNFVENTAGTGFVHIAPGHGQDDYNLGRQNGLPIYSPVDDDGRLATTNDLPIDQQFGEALAGRSILPKQGRSEANEAVLDVLRSKNALLHLENYSHSYPHCWRSKTPVIFRAMDQWFVNVDHDGFRQKALQAIQGVSWIPEWGQNRIEGAVKTRPDWCISRQRTWGVPIPAFYAANGEAILNADVVRNTAKLVASEGSNVWFEINAQELWALVKPANWTGAAPVSKSADTLDVWIDSGSSSRAVLMQRKELQHEAGTTHPWQADVYLEGSDQHRGWFQSSLLLSLAANGAAPFKSVLTHGFLVDADREKISKSKQGQGGYEKPQTSEAYVNKYGADIVRLWVASQDYRNDIVVSEQRVEKVAETYRLIRNTLRYQLSNLYDFDLSGRVPVGELTGLDRWILERFSDLEREVIAAYDRYEFHVVYQKISQFVAVELSAVYHDLVKDRLYTTAAASKRRRSTQTVLLEIATRLCQALAPIMPFTTDEAWQMLPAAGRAESVHLSSWTPLEFARPEAERELWAQMFGLREAALTPLEKERQSGTIGKSLDAFVRLTVPAALAQRLPTPDLLELLNVSAVDVAPSKNEDISIEAARVPEHYQRCERCWHWEPKIGENANHPTLCGRCVEAVV